ncbi:MAG: D-glycero-beta-D-manno-heptose-7-phosphate kinase [Chitinophagales bacterium]|nr:D-glycero-beta-D-manno-heptose-7-phosphate kinase [Chitinophagales bacterium]
MLDTYLWGQVNRISPEAPVPVVSIEKKDERPGGAANVALNVKLLGATPFLCSVIGNDESGRSFLKMLNAYQIGTEGIFSSNTRVTTVKSRIISRNQQMMRFDSETEADLNSGDEKKLLNIIRNTIMREKPHALIFEDYNKGVLTEPIINEVIGFCRKSKVLCSVDPKKKRFFSYKNVNVFKPNLRELRDALKMDHLETDTNQLDKAVDVLKIQLHQQITLITLSEDGIYYHNGAKGSILAAHMRDIADVSGAGDTVIATATLALAAGMPLEYAASIANIAGGLVCEHVGVIPITREMLIEQWNS